MMSAGQYQIHVQQPTVPHYRVPFFDALAERHEGRVQVYASRSVGDGPASAKVDRNYLSLNHDCSLLFGKRVYWQHGMLPSDKAIAGDVAVISPNPRYLSTFKFAAAARRRGMGIVWWGHGWSPTSRQWAIKVRRYLMSTVDAVLLYSDAEAMEWRPRLPAHIAVIGAQNAIDQSASSAQRADWNSERLNDFRREQGLDGRKILLFCGRLRTQPGTGVDLLIRALTILKQTDPGYLAVIIGDGDDLLRLRQLAQELGVAEQVRWLGAQYEEANIAPWFLSSLCFTYPGPIGLSILHAMGYGLPVVTHNDRRRHNPEIVVLREGWNGLMFHDGDINDLANKIQYLAGNEEHRQVLAANAYATAHEEFTLQNMVERFSAAAEHARLRALARNS